MIITKIPCSFFLKHTLYSRNGKIFDRIPYKTETHDKATNTTLIPIYLNLPQTHLCKS